MFTPGSVSLLREVYNWTLADMNVNDIDDQKYMLCKRLSEVRNSLTVNMYPLSLTINRSWPTASVCSSNKSLNPYLKAAI
jgi:hypothetical protein